MARQTLYWGVIVISIGTIAMTFLEYWGLNLGLHTR
jgi:hypothetical protein